MNVPKHAACKILCPECRVEFDWSSYVSFMCVDHAPTNSSNEKVYTKGYPSETANAANKNTLLQAEPAHDCITDSGTRSNHVPEAFVRLHHLWQGNDEKEKPLLRLLKELDLNARVYYGKPALIHLQGSKSDVESFAGTAKRRHITISIDVVQRSTGP